LKQAYIAQLKRLLLTYHPDVCGRDEYAQKAHHDITVALTAALERAKSAAKDAAQDNAVTSDYYYYKQGITYYQKIHPNAFYKTSGSTFEPKTYDEQLQILNAIFVSFTAAEYYFSKVINEYPQSPWAADAQAKLQLLEKLHKSYENINIAENNKTIDCTGFVNEMGLSLL
jgi:outer membrane protein assembly factor BamD (BamD/ComL family)